MFSIQFNVLNNRDMIVTVFKIKHLQSVSPLVNLAEQSSA